MNIWDAGKRAANLAKHDVDFRDLSGLAWSEAIVFEDLRRDNGERGLIAMVPLAERLHVVVYVERRLDSRIISARKANSREVAFYEKEARASERKGR